MDRWKNRVALVTAAANGMGAETVRRLTSRGLNVVGCDILFDKLQKLGDEVKDAPGEFYPIKCDLRKEAEILAMFDVIKKEHGGVDVCINNAGLARSSSLIDCPTEDWREEWEVNVMARCICVRESLKSMKERGVDDGHIIFINSIAAHMIPSFMHHYTATKWASQAIILGLRQELRQIKSKIRVTEISPSVTKTASLAALGEEVEEKFYASNPYLRVADVADAIEYVLSAPTHVEVHDIILAHTDDELRGTGRLN